ncbi:ycf3-interacting protein 1, chloroplastic [Physcomitrium patens]|uniref:Uncharacterized protein n=1 Tax=Physcomitrium patens TaxID=3218 RepID=A0A2K1JCE5_PHYPA|nr:ycf3-interacting protein 1, chloroplastic-like [Physcomitrium patens]PNR39202.1 hypothetical protein PHYPA_019480 [Physcomitrium patens]|eukprot:XP_024397723.1 ycf3-interacting protein 1, chloroplastic-like [Physcomitrella patens]
MVEVTMTGAMATVSLTGTPCRCSSPELAATHPAAAGRPIAGLTQGARMLGVGGRVELQFSPRNYLNLQRGQRQDRKLQEKVVSVQNVAGLWRRTAGSARAVVRAMAEDSSSESSVTTEERALSPEEEEDQANVSEILRVLDLLKKKRDMTFNEVRLTIMIEDPREVERRRQLGIEDERGCSKEDMGIALQEVYEGRLPEDRLVLRELTKEMLAWPNLEDEISEVNPLASPYAKVTPTGVDPKVAAQRAKVDWDAAAEIQPGEEPKDLSDMVPPVVGFSFLYLVSFIPVIIVVAVVLILFFNSLQ